MRPTLKAALLCLTLINPLPALAQAQGPAVSTAKSSIDPDLQARIRKEGMENSQIMRTMHYFSDVYGPRLTGSPNHKNAADWAVKQMATWGFDNSHLEPWDFGRPGWLNERLTAHVISPFKEPLVCEVLGWTPSTNGTVSGQAVQLILPERPTQEVLTAYFEKIKDQVKGKIVLAGKHVLTAVVITPPAKRMEDQQAKTRYSGNAPAGPAPGVTGPRPEPQQPQPGQLRPAQILEQLDAFLVANGVLVRVNGSEMEQRRIRAFSNRTFDPAKAVPTVIMSNEDYGRITRIMADETPIELEFNIVNRLYPEGKTSYNVIAEIAGSDKKDEVIMLGGHLDSWHAATGATDNAIGCATMMEAARILKAIGVKPRRTIRVALWSGEEQGLLGSLAYVKEHFGTFDNPKPDYFKFGGYFNIDSGTGKARGMGAFGPPEIAEILRPVLGPFEDLGIMGAITSRSRGLGGSDNSSFSQVGLPGIGVGQDPIEYFNVTWHTNLDTYERIIEDDAKRSAIVIAAAVYFLATRDELLPRFSKEEMPALPPARP